MIGAPGHVARRRRRHRRERVAARPRRLDLREIAARACRAHQPRPSRAPSTAERRLRRLRARRRRAAVHALEHRHHVDFGRRRVAAALALAASARARSRSDGAAAIDDRRARVGRDDVELGQVLVQVGVDGGDVAHRRLVQLLQDLELDAPVGLDRSSAPRRTRRRSPRATSGLASVPRSGRPSRKPRPRFSVCSSSWREVLDDARDVAGEHRLVHRRGFDQREVRRVRLGEVGLVGRLAGDAVVDRCGAAASRTPPSAPGARPSARAGHRERAAAPRARRTCWRDPSAGRRRGRSSARTRSSGARSRDPGNRPGSSRSRAASREARRLGLVVALTAWIWLVVSPATVVGLPVQGLGARRQ